MKKQSLIIFLLFYFISSFGQIITVFSSGDDQNNSFENNMVEVGFKSNGTIGIDSLLGEMAVNEENTRKNIFAIQRVNGNTECSISSDSVEIYFTESLSLNKDFREKNKNLLSNNFFQIKNRSLHVNKITVADLTDTPLKENIRSVSVNRYCGDSLLLDVKHFNLSSISGFDFSVISFESDSLSGIISSILIEFKGNTSNNSIERQLTDIDFFPNPVNNSLTISDIENLDKILVFNSFGDKALSINQFSSNQIDLSNLKNGIYFLSIHLKNGESFSSKIIKN